MLTDSGFTGEARETAQKLVSSSFSLHTGCGLHGGRKLSRNSPHLLGFSCLGPIRWGRSPKEVTHRPGSSRPQGGRPQLQSAPPHPALTAGQPTLSLTVWASNTLEEKRFGVDFPILQK
jgi:hypothetical protein